MEAVRQALVTIESLFEGLRESPLVADPTQGFDLSKRRFRKGQWVDVKDTVNEWLEAQVMDMQEEGRMRLVFIHYNGWPLRWDEWLESSSRRIAPFRTYTKQGVDAQMQSPIPVSPPSYVNIARDELIDGTEFFVQATEALNRTQWLVQEYNDLAKIVAREKFLNQGAVLPVQPPIDFPIDLESGSDKSSFDSYEDSETEEATQVFYSPAEMQFLMRGEQVALLTDRVGRLLIDLAVLTEPKERIQTREALSSLRAMPSPGRLMEENPEPDALVQIILQPSLHSSNTT